MGMKTKSGLILGMGETVDEARDVMQDLRSVGCDILTIGQYLQPTKAHLPVCQILPPRRIQPAQNEGLAMDPATWNPAPGAQFLIMPNSRPVLPRRAVNPAAPLRSRFAPEGYSNLDPTVNTHRCV